MPVAAIIPAFRAGTMESHDDTLTKLIKATRTDENSDNEPTNLRAPMLTNCLHHSLNHVPWVLFCTMLSRKL